MIEITLPENKMIKFKNSLIISSAKKAFNVSDHQTVAQVIDGLSRKFYLIDSCEELKKMRETMIIEIVSLIHKNRLSNFLSTCPACGHRQFDHGVVQCSDCNQKYRTPGYR